MVARGNDLSRNPNLCASCSSLADGMDDSGAFPPANTLPAHTPNLRAAAPANASTVGEVLLEWAEHEAPKRPNA